MARERILIDGIAYDVVAETTPESAERDGMPNLAQHMRETRKVRQLGLQRPKGTVVYHVAEYRHPVYGLHFGEVVSLGRAR